MSIDIPGSAAPNNLHFGADVGATIVEGDLYNICSRLEEVNPSLFIVALESPDGKSFAIMEHCEDGWDRLVWRVAELDARVVKKAEYLQKVPFDRRLEEAEKAEAQMEAEDNLNAFESLYEKLGAPMRRELAKTGFIDSNVSYPIVSRK